MNRVWVSALVLLIVGVVFYRMGYQEAALQLDKEDMQVARSLTQEFVKLHKQQCNGKPKPSVYTPMIIPDRWHRTTMRDM